MHFGVHGRIYIQPQVVRCYFMVKFGLDPPRKDLVKFWFIVLFGVLQQPLRMLWGFKKMVTVFKFTAPEH